MTGYLLKLLVFMDYNNFEDQKRKHPKDKFSKDEDEKLLQLIKENGIEDWSRISKQMNGRNTRQCRERWNKYLSPHLNTNPWTEDEDDLLNKKYNEIGPSWKIIATFFQNRTDINVKNRWLKLERHRKKEIRKLQKAQMNGSILKTNIVEGFDWTKLMNSMFEIFEETDEMNECI